MELVGKGIAGASAAIPARAATLDHELRNHAVKRQPVIVILFHFYARHLVRKFLPALRQSYEIFLGLRRFFFEQAHHNIALRSFKNGVSSCGSAHAISLCAKTSYTRRRIPRHLTMGECLPAFLLAQFVDWRRMVPAMPFIEKEQPVHVALSIVGVHEDSRKIFGFQGSPQPVPAGMQRVQQTLGYLNRRGFRVRQFGPCGLLIRLDCWLFLSERPLQSNVAIKFTSRTVLSTLP